MKPRAMTVAEFRARGLSVDASGRVSKAGSAKKSAAAKRPARPRKILPMACGAGPERGEWWAVIPMYVPPGMNTREDKYVRSARVKDEHAATMAALAALATSSFDARSFRLSVERGYVAAHVKLTRVSTVVPEHVDSDNAVGSMKSARDRIAKWLGVDDGDETRVTWEYARAKGAGFGVRVEITQTERGKKGTK